MNFEYFKKLFHLNNNTSGQTEIDKYVSICEKDMLSFKSELENGGTISHHRNTITLPTFLWCCDKKKLSQVCTKLQTKFNGFTFYSEEYTEEESVIDYGSWWKNVLFQNSVKYDGRHGSHIKFDISNVSDNIKNYDNDIK